MLIVVFMYLLMGTIFTASKMGLQQAEPLFFLGTRMILAGICLVLYVLFFEKKRPELTKRNIASVLFLGFLNIYLTNAFEFWAMRFVSAAKASFLFNLSPFFSAVLGFLFFKEKLSHKKWVGLAIGFLGFLPILYIDAQSEDQLGGFYFISSAELSLILAVLCAINGFTLMQKMVNEFGFTPVTANAYSTLIGGILAMTHSYFFETWNPVPIFGNANLFWTAILWTMVASSFLFYNMAGYALKKFSVTFVAFCSFMTPFLTAFFSFLVLGEPIEMVLFVSGAIVFIGLYLFYVEELKLGIRVNEPS